jgi:hypothetical protein
MFECERKAVFVDKSDPNNVTKRKSGWVVSPVLGIPKGTEIRCMHCRGSVKIHRQKQVQGIRDHVEHREHEDSENCKAGIFFKGIHRISNHSVE